MKLWKRLEIESYVFNSSGWFDGQWWNERWRRRKKTFFGQDCEVGNSTTYWKAKKTFSQRFVAPSNECRREGKDSSNNNRPAPHAGENMQSRIRTQCHSLFWARGVAGYRGTPELTVALLVRVCLKQVFRRREENCSVLKNARKRSRKKSISSATQTFSSFFSDSKEKEEKK